MQESLLSGALAASILFLSLAAATVRAAPPPLFLSFYLLLDAMFFYLYIGSSGFEPKQAIFTAQSWLDYNTYGATALLAVLAVSNALAAGIVIGGRAALRRKTPTDPKRLRVHSITTQERGAVLAILMVIGTVEILHFALIDKDILLGNQTYLLLRNPIAHGLTTGLERLIFFSLRPAGFLAALTLGFAVGAGERRLAVFAAILLAYPIAYEFAQNSRAAAAMLAAVPAVIFASNCTLTKKLVSTLLVIPVALLVYLKALVGRSTVWQGLAGTAEVIGEMVRRGYTVGEILRGLGFNLFQTTQTVANALQLGGSYDLMYKIGSFSPLPSLIDQMGEYMRYAQYRVNAYVPYNAIAEAYLFGATWFVVLEILAIVWAAWVTKRWICGNSVERIAGLMSLLGCVQFVQYPLRNSVRYFVLSVMLIAIARVHGRRKRSARYGVRRRCVKRLA